MADAAWWQFTKMSDAREMDPLIQLMFLSGLSPRRMAGPAKTYLDTLGLSPFQQVALIGGLQLYPLAHCVSRMSGDDRARRLGDFFNRSLSHRTNIARLLIESLAESVQSEGGCITPIKSSLFMMNGYKPFKYFRDVDFLVKRSEFEIVLKSFKNLSGFLGYVDEDDSRITTMPEDAGEDFTSRSEVFGTILAGLPPAAIVEQSMDELPVNSVRELDFYVEISGRIHTRTFFNFIFVDSDPSDWADMEDLKGLYARQLLKDTRHDIDDGITKVSALVALFRLKDQLAESRDVFLSSLSISPRAIASCDDSFATNLERARKLPQ